MRKNTAVPLLLALLVCVSARVRAADYDYYRVNLDWGVPAALPLAGDFDGDGLADPACYVESTGLWAVLMSGSHYAEIRATLGGPGARPAPADYDGDGKTDPAVFRQADGRLTVMLSGSSYAMAGMDFPAGSFCTAADYDGDGLDDPASYNPAAGQWQFLMRQAREVTDTNILAGMYSNAMANASQPTAAKICTDLTAITTPADHPWQIWRTNELGGLEIKMVSFMRYATATNYYHPGQITELKYAFAWVTVAPELKNFCRNYAGTNLNLRLRQLIGLPAVSANDTIVEFWVDPQYLLRPSKDPEIVDYSAQLEFHTNALFLTMQTDTNYVGWFNQNLIDANYGMTNGVWNSLPWTQLGYTYDWGGVDADIVGLSEFIIPGSLLWERCGTVVGVEVDSVTPAVDYANTPDRRARDPRAPDPRSLPRLVAPPGDGRRD